MSYDSPWYQFLNIGFDEIQLHFIAFCGTQSLLELYKTCNEALRYRIFNFIPLVV